MESANPCPYGAPELCELWFWEWHYKGALENLGIVCAAQLGMTLETYAEYGWDIAITDEFLVAAHDNWQFTADLLLR